MQRVFMRALWGDKRVERFPQVIGQAVSNPDKMYPINPLVVYVFGEDNERLLKDLGYATVLLDKRPVVDFIGSGIRAPDLRANINYGINMFAHKIYAMKVAAHEHQEVTWVDWDCSLVKPLPESYWEDRGKGAIVQVCLVQYRRFQALWRQSHRRKTVESAWVYFRDAAFMDRVFEIHLQNPEYNCQLAIARAVDELEGDFSPELWQAKGYEPNGIHHVAGVEHCFPEDLDKILFVTRRSKTSSVKHHIEFLANQDPWKVLDNPEAVKSLRDKFPAFADEVLKCI